MVGRPFCSYAGAGQVGVLDFLHLHFLTKSTNRVVGWVGFIRRKSESRLNYNCYADFYPSQIFDPSQVYSFSHGDFQSDFPSNK